MPILLRIAVLLRHFERIDASNRKRSVVLQRIRDAE